MRKARDVVEMTPGRWEHLPRVQLLRPLVGSLLTATSALPWGLGPNTVSSRDSPDGLNLYI